MRRSYLAPVIAIILGATSCHSSNYACKYSAEIVPTNSLYYHKIEIESTARVGVVLYSKLKKQSNNVVASERRKVPPPEVSAFCDNQIAISKKVYRKGDVVDIFLDGPALNVAIKRAGNNVVVNESMSSYMDVEYNLIQSLNIFTKRAGVRNRPYDVGRN